MHPTHTLRTPLLLISLACTMPALADDEQAKAIEAFRKEAQSCKASAAAQDIGFDLKPVAGKTASELPATPEELERVKRLLAKSNLPFDTVNHRATFEFTLALVRVKKVAAFRVTDGDARQNAAVHECLTRLAAGVGLAPRFD